MDVESDFIRRVTGDDGTIDLARAAFTIALDEFPDLDVASFMARLDDLGDQVRNAANGDESREALLRALDHTLFESLGFSGNTADYYDPNNSYLNQVLERRQGIPITLCVLYMEVAKRVGVMLDPVGFPSHFLVSSNDGTTRHFIDPFHGGRHLSEGDLWEQLVALVGPEQADALFDQAVAAVPLREVVARILRNLKLIHVQAQDWARALPVSHKLVALEEGAGAELRDRGRILEHLEAFRAAATDYANYLELHSDADDAPAVRRQLSVLSQKVNRLN